MKIASLLLNHRVHLRGHCKAIVDLVFTRLLSAKTVAVDYTANGIAKTREIGVVSPLLTDIARILAVNLRVTSTASAAASISVTMRNSGSFNTGIDRL